MDDIIVKRVHVSGLTPSITAADVSQRLSSFGTVKAVDGFGLLDAVGRPRKFGYVTLETTKTKLARCMNLLSGVTWKGAKLRLGEAKPDFRERIAKEHESLKRMAEDGSSEPPSKRRRLPRGVLGVHNADMTLVTPENAATRPGWRVSTLGRLIRPIRMRPEHPLPQPLARTLAESKDGKKGAKLRPKRVKTKQPSTRARRRTIDPTKWGSQHTKGIFLENVTTGLPATTTGITLSHEHSPNADAETSSEDEDKEQYGVGERDESPVTAERVGLLSPPKAPFPASLRAPPAKLLVSQHTNVLRDAADLLPEKQASLGLLQFLFGDRGNEEWGGREELDSDIDLGDEAARSTAQDEHEDDGNAMDDETAPPDHVQLPDQQSQEASPTASAPTQKTKLKYLFAPREEDAGFSLLGNLDLDLELDEELGVSLPAEPQTRPATQVATVIPIAPSLTAFDPKRSLFFPLPAEDRGRARGRDALDTTNWRTLFFRTEPEEDIQKRWEETRGELTRGWKTRHREAVKARRRRGGGADEVES